jgi:para-aminobenzoate synthetase component 1
MLTWAFPFNICCFLDSHSYDSPPPAFECLLAVGAADSFSAAAGQAFSGLKEWAAGRQDWLLGHLAYDLTAETEGVGGDFPDAIGFPDVFFFQPVHVIIVLKDSVRIGCIGEDPESVWQQIRATEPLSEAGTRLRTEGEAQPQTEGDTQFRTEDGAQPRTENDARPRPGATPGSRPATAAGSPEPLGPVPSQPPAEPLEPQPAGGPINFTPRFTREEYLSTVDALRRHILRGDCYEINFCQEFFAQPVSIDPYATWQALSQASPNPFSAFYRLDHRYLLCASPERFLKKTGDTLFSQPIKGTAPRRQDGLADRRRQQELYHSAKDRAENVMVVDLVRNDLSRICRPGSVRVSELFGIYAFPQVYQMISTITGTLLPGLDWTDALRHCFPMGSMTGAPKHRVTQLIARYERSRRGLFSGAVGYITPEGDFDWNVVIRSLLYNQQSGYLSYQVGSGITWYSDPEAEYEECLVKAEGIRKALGQ